MHGRARSRHINTRQKIVYNSSINSIHAYFKWNLAFLSKTQWENVLRSRIAHLFNTVICWICLMYGMSYALVQWHIFVVRLARQRHGWYWNADEVEWSDPRDKPKRTSELRAPWDPQDDRTTGTVCAYFICPDETWPWKREENRRETRRLLGALLHRNSVLMTTDGSEQSNRDLYRLLSLPRVSRLEKRSSQHCVNRINILYNLVVSAGMLLSQRHPSDDAFCIFLFVIM